MTSAQQTVWDDGSASPSLKSYTLANFRSLPQLESVPEHMVSEMEVVGNVLPFKANNYVVEQLIDWDDIPNDPMFVLTFPQRGMLRPEHYAKMESALNSGAGKEEIARVANEIRLQLNPHPAGQMELNVPALRDGTKLYGMQHKYKETCLFFPSQSQTCHAYCSFCFRWPQFVGMDEMKFAMKEGEQLVQYVSEHPEITDILFTGGDPMIMKARIFAKYADAIIESRLPHLKTVRIGTKALAYWPYKFLTDPDAEEMLDVFRRITESGLHLAFMSHFNHLNELSTDAVAAAIKKVRATGAQIRTQSPLLAHINDDAQMWGRMWTQAGQHGLHSVLHVRGQGHGRAALLWRAACQGVRDIQQGVLVSQRAGKDGQGPQHVGHARQGAGLRRRHDRRPEDARAPVPAGKEPRLGAHPVLCEI